MKPGPMGPDICSGGEDPVRDGGCEGIGPDFGGAGVCSDDDAHHTRSPLTPTLYMGSTEGPGGPGRGGIMAYESFGADGGWGRMGRPTISLLRRMRPAPSPEGLCSSSLGRSSPDVSSSVSKSPAVARLMRVLGEAHAGSFMKPCSTDILESFLAVEIGRKISKGGKVDSFSRGGSVRHWLV